MNIKEAQEIANRGWMERAKVAAADRGEAFLVFLGGGASYLFKDQGAAREQARQSAAYMGKENVRITRVRVPDTKI